VKRLLAVTVLTGLSTTGDMVAFQTVREAPITMFLCDGELEFGVQFLEKGSKAVLSLSDTETFVLQRVKTASGTRYRNKNLDLIIEGKQAILRVGGKLIGKDCMAQHVEDETPGKKPDQ
jgi:membrane-bound inhibitor of C-type lysozyme